MNVCVGLRRRPRQLDLNNAFCCQPIRGESQLVDVANMLSLMIEDAEDQTVTDSASLLNFRKAAVGSKGDALNRFRVATEA